MKTYHINAYGNDYEVRVRVRNYNNNGTLALSLVTTIGEPFCDLTVNIMDSMIWADKNHAFVDTNNCSWAEDFIVDNNLGNPVGITGASGFCVYPLYEFYLDELTK